MPHNQELIDGIARDYGLARQDRFGRFEVGGPITLNDIKDVTGGEGIEAVNSGGLITWADAYKPSEWLKRLQNPKMRSSVEEMLPKIAANIERDIGSLPLSK